MHKRSPIKHDMTSNNTTAALGAGAGTFPSAQSSSWSTTYTYTYAFVLVWPSLVLALTSIAIAVVNINDASSLQSKYSPLYGKDLGGRGLLAQIGLLVCATVLHASSIWRPHDESFPPNAAATSKTGDDIPPDPHAVLNASVFLTVFVNILCNVAAVSWTDYNSSAKTAKCRYIQPSTEMMRSVSIANLGPLVYSILLIMESRGNDKARNLHKYNQWHMAMVSYAVVLTVAQFIQRVVNKRREQRSVLAGIPLANGHYRSGREIEGASMPPPRTDRWHEWSADEVAQWVSSLPRLGSYGSNTMANDGFSIGRSKFTSSGSNHHYASLLQEECVDGMALAGISIDTLRSFGIPYGHATALRRTIGTELVSRYGIGDLQLNEDALRHNGTLFDSSTTTSSMERKAHVSSGHEGVAALADAIDPDMAEKASELFAERFGGMKLANFETGDSSTASSGVSRSDPTRQMVGLVGGNSVLDTVEEEGAGVGGVRGNEQQANPVSPPSVQLSEALLLSLPPNVREVAMRRPELFSSMLRNRGIDAAGAGVANDSAPLATGSGTSEDEMALHWADDDDEEAPSSDMVGLLRRRPATSAMSPQV